MTKPNRFTTEQIIAAIQKHGGLVYAAARSLRCSPTTIYNYAKRYASVQEALDNEKGLILDVTEGSLIGAIKRGEGWAVTFMLRTQGKGRGYGDQVSVRHGGDPDNPAPIRHEVKTFADLLALADGDAPRSADDPRPDG